MSIIIPRGQPVPDPDPAACQDPFELLLESEGRESLGLRYDYIADILEEEFEETYLRFFSASILHYEVINLVSVCATIMADCGFPKIEATRWLRYAVIAAIATYLEE